MGSCVSLHSPYGPYECVGVRTDLFLPNWRSTTATTTTAATAAGTRQAGGGGKGRSAGVQPRESSACTHTHGSWR